MGRFDNRTVIVDTRDRAEIYDRFNRYADAVAGRQWKLLDQVFTEDVTDARLGSPEIEGRAALVRRMRDVIEPTAETHLLGNYTATFDGDVAEASVRFRVYQLWAPGLLHQKILGFFRVELVRTGKGWRFRHFRPGAVREIRRPGAVRLDLRSEPKSYVCRLRRDLVPVSPIACIRSLMRRTSRQSSSAARDTSPPSTAPRPDRYRLSDGKWHPRRACSLGGVAY